MEEREGAVTFRAGGASWTVGTELRSGRPAPGYVHRFCAGGRRLLDDGAGWGNSNDPDFGGIGNFALHHARRRAGEATLGDYPGFDGSWERNNAWPLDLRWPAADAPGGVVGARAARVVDGPLLEPGGAARLGVEVDAGDEWTERLFAVRYSWLFRADGSARLTVTYDCPGHPDGPPAFLKEPKVCLRLGGSGSSPLPRELVGLAPDGGPPLRWARSLPRTAQASPRRRSLEFRCDGRTLLQADVSWSDWAGWPAAASRREKFAGQDSPMEALWDCHEGKFRAKTELVGWQSRGAPGYRAASFLVCAYQGGRGPYDCEPLYTAYAAESRRIAIDLLPLGA